MSIKKIYIINDEFTIGKIGKSQIDDFCSEHLPEGMEFDYFPFDKESPMEPQLDKAVVACITENPDLVILDVYFGKVGERKARLGLTKALPKLVKKHLPVIVLSALETQHQDADENITEAQQHGQVKYLSGKQLEKLKDYISSFNVVGEQDRASETFGFKYRFYKEIQCIKDFEKVFNLLLSERYNSQPIELPLAAPVSNFLGPSPKPIPEKDSNKLFSTVTTDGRAMAVRYEGTALTAKKVAELATSDDWPGIRYHYFQEMARVETSADLDKSHYRSFYQAGFEVFTRDRKQHGRNVVDVLEFTVEMLREVKLEPTLRLSHVHIIPKLLEDFDPDGFKRRRIIGAMEKEKDISKVEEILKVCTVPDEHYNILIALAKLREDSTLREGLKQLKQYGSRYKEAREDLEEIVDVLHERKLDKFCRFDPGIYRSLDFYSGITMQGDVPGQEECLGGGDFTGLVEVFGAEPKVHAFGMAIGVDRLVKNVLLG